MREGWREAGAGTVGAWGRLWAAGRHQHWISQGKLEGTSSSHMLDPGWAGEYSHSHFTDEEMESQNASAACPKSPFMCCSQVGRREKA